MKHFDVTSGSLPAANAGSTAPPEEEAATAAIAAAAAAFKPAVASPERVKPPSPQQLLLLLSPVAAAGAPAGARRRRPRLRAKPLLGVTGAVVAAAGAEGHSLGSQAGGAAARKAPANEAWALAVTIAQASLMIADQTAPQQRAWSAF